MFGGGGKKIIKGHRSRYQGDKRTRRERWGGRGKEEEGETEMERGREPRRRRRRGRGRQRVRGRGRQRVRGRGRQRVRGRGRQRGRGRVRGRGRLILILLSYRGEQQSRIFREYRREEGIRMYVLGSSKFLG
jgi:hypothetical protein